MSAYLNEHEATDSDFLIQLSDTLANKNGIVTIEQRAEEYAQRNGLNLTSSLVQEMLAPRFELKECFDKKIGVMFTSFLQKYQQFPESGRGVAREGK